MQQIYPPIENVAAIVGAQKYDGTAELRKAYHCVEVPVEAGVLLWHSLTGEMLYLLGAEYRRALTDEALRQVLAEKRFLVPRDFDENRFADQLKGVVALMQKPWPVKNFKIFTTLDCNARCFYCYEKGRPRPAMSAQTARDVADYIARVSGGKEVRLNWFGGEPLFNRPVIDVITTALMEKGVAYTSGMISNGYLFDAETVKHARECWKLQKIQITLDGTEPVYNRTKAFVDAAGSAFRRVLGNIDLLLDAGIQVKIRLNVHRGNAADLLELADQLAQRFGTRENLMVYAALLRDMRGSFISMEEREALELFCQLDSRLLELHLRRPAPLARTLKLNYCMADQDSSVTILPNGDLGKCEHFSESELIGSIYTEERDAATIASWKEVLDRTEACRTCANYPRCTYLKKCPYVLNLCTETDRAMRLDKLKESVYHAYCKGTQSEEEPEDC